MTRWIAKTIIYLEISWLNFWIKLVPHTLMGIDLNGAIQEAVIERDGRRFHLVWEPIPNNEDKDGNA